MPSPRIPLRLIALVSFALAACATGPTATPTEPPATPVPPTAVVLATATVAPPTTAPSATPAATAVPVPASALRFAVRQGNEVVLVAPDGQTHPLAEAPVTFYAFTDLTGQPGGAQQVYALGPEGAEPLDFIQDVNQGFAAWRDPASGEVRLAWDTYSVGAATGALQSQIMVSGPSGEQTRVLIDETGSERVLRVVGWAPDGQRLFYSKEPLGLGGYILFSGFSDLWGYDWTTGESTTVVPEAAAGVICLDDFTLTAALVAHHCAEGQISVLDLNLGMTSAILPPAEVAGEAGVLGRARFSPAEDQLAFSLARGDPEAEQGWVAVSDGLAGPARLVATAEAGDYFDVLEWLDDDTLLLQSWADPPGIWTVNSDGSELVRLADGVFLTTVFAE